MIEAESIAFVGGGMMAEAIMRGLLAGEITQPELVSVGEPVAERREYLARTHGVRAVAENREAVFGAKIIIIAVKPQHAPAALAEIHGLIAKEALALSIAAGITIQTLRDGLAHGAIVRVMPNTPAQIGEGISVWTATEEVSPQQREQARAILSSLGKEIQAPEEKYLDMATGLSGSGPGFVYLFLEALVDAGVRIGFARNTATELAYQTVLGSTLMAMKTGKHPAELRNAVTSPAGTTAAGLYELEAGGFRTAVDRAVMAAFQRAVELGQSK